MSPAPGRPFEDILAERVLAPSSVAQMIADQLTPAQKAASPFVPGFWDGRGWGFCLSGDDRTRRRDPARLTVGTAGSAPPGGTARTKG